jgi:DNA repair protein RadC
MVDPREVFLPAIQCRASAVILAHNHPSGDPEPSEEDRLVTERVRLAGQILKVPLVDHLIVAGRQVTSFQARGWL